ncbi:MAG: VIT domain-containing protein [Gemmatimonadales bacterium]
MSAPLAAQGWIEPLPGRPRPAVMSVVKIRTQVDVTIRGRIAEVVVNEWFMNRGGPFGEADYHFPLPGEAVFGNYSLWQGDQELRGEMMHAQDARQIYEDIVRRRRDPALIEFAGRGLIRARVFPFAPGEERRVTLRYVQMLDAAGQALGFRYVAGRRDSVPVAITVTVPDGAQFLEPFSPTHELDVRRDRGRLVVRPTARPTGEIAIFFPPAEPTVGLTMVTHRPAGERDGWFMLTLTPGNDAQQSVPRDIAVVVDVSGSMSGSKMEQARGALHQLLGTLTPRDRFRLIAFGPQVRAQAPDWTPATPDAVREARTWVDGLRADGGTNIAGALQEAFRVEPAAQHLPIVLFLTDGLPTVGERDPEVIADHAESQHGRARVFAFGVGYDVNTYLLDRLSAAGRGRTEYVEPDQDIEASVGRLASMISRPLLTDLALTLPAGITDVYPRQLPDLFQGEELIIFGRYREARGTQTIALMGRAGGESRRFTVRADLAPTVEANDFVAKLWAGRKLGELHRQARLEGATPALIAEIRDHALRYGLLSEYTAYLVQEPQFALNGRVTPMPAPAAPGAGASGMGAVQQAERDRGRREQRTLVQATAAEDAVAAQFAPRGTGRTVAGRVFRQEAGVWTDASARDSLRLVHIAPFSPAYFAVLRALPELVPYAEAFDAVTVAGVRVRIRIAEGGRDTVSGVDRLVADFRGR